MHCLPFCSCLVTVSGPNTAKAQDGSDSETIKNRGHLRYRQVFDSCHVSSYVTSVRLLVPQQVPWETINTKQFTECHNDIMTHIELMEPTAKTQIATSQDLSDYQKRAAILHCDRCMWTLCGFDFTLSAT